MGTFVRPLIKLISARSQKSQSNIQNTRTCSTVTINNNSDNEKILDTRTVDHPFSKTIIQVQKVWYTGHKLQTIIFEYEYILK